MSQKWFLWLDGARQQCCVHVYMYTYVHVYISAVCWLNCQTAIDHHVSWVNSLDAFTCFKLLFYFPLFMKPNIYNVCCNPGNNGEDNIIISVEILCSNFILEGSKRQLSRHCPKQNQKPGVSHGP